MAGLQKGLVKAVTDLALNKLSTNATSSKLVYTNRKTTDTFTIPTTYADLSGYIVAEALFTNNATDNGQIVVTNTAGAASATVKVAPNTTAVVATGSNTAATTNYVFLVDNTNAILLTDTYTTQVTSGQSYVPALFNYTHTYPA